MTERREPVGLKFDDNFASGLRSTAGNIRRAALELDGRLSAGLIDKIDAISGDDPERAHSELDDLLESTFPAEVRAAIQRLRDRSSWWGAA